MSVWSAPSARSASAVRGAAWCVVRACRICTGTGLTPALIYARPHWAAPDRKRRRPVPRLGQWCVVFRFLDSVHADSHRGGRVAVALAVVRGCCSPHAWRRSHVCLFVCLRVALLLAAELPLPPRSLFQWHELYNPPPPTHTHTPFPIPSSAIVAYRCCRSLHCARGKLACRLRRARKTHSPCRCGRGAPSRGADVAGAALGRPWRFALCHEKQNRRCVSVHGDVTAAMANQPWKVQLHAVRRLRARGQDITEVLEAGDPFARARAARAPWAAGWSWLPPSPAHICTGTERTCYLSRASLRVAPCSWLRPPMHRSMEQGV